jgi:O-antigen/teichoic acid export membrane protein
VNGADATVSPSPEPSPAVDVATLRREGRRSAGKGVVRRQIRGSSLLLAGRLLSRGVNFCVQVLIVRYLTKSDFGAFAYALGIVHICQTVVTFGLDRAVTRFVPIFHEQHDYRKMFGTLVMVVTTMAALGLSTVVLAYGAEALMGESLIPNASARAILLILIFLAPIDALDSVLIGMFAVFASPRAIFFRKHVLAPLLRLSVVLALVYQGFGVRFLAAGYVLTGVAGVSIYSVLLLRLLRSEGLLARFRLAKAEIPWWTVLSFTVPLLTSDLVYAVMHATNTVLLEHFTDTLAVASLRAVVPLALMNQLVLASFATLFTPQAARLFARNDRAGINYLYWQLAMWIAVLSFPVFAVTFSLAEPVTVLLFGSEYQESGLILAVLAFGYYFNAALGPNGLTLKIYGKVGYIVKLNLVTVAVNVAVNLALIPRYGAFGAALGTTATLVVHNILKHAGLLLGTGIRLFEPRYLRAYLVIGIAALGLLGVQLWLDAPVAAELALAALVSLWVVRANRHLLDVEDVVPELMRIPGMRRLLGK